MAVVNGFPAISYLFGGTLVFTMNDAVDGGGNWAGGNVQASGVFSGSGTFLKVIDGFPCIGFHSSTGPRMARNSSADAAGAWTIVNPLPSSTTSSVGYYATIFEASGVPVMLCADFGTSDVRFLRASSADGAGAWTGNFIENTGSVGSFSSAAVVDGLPAIAYYDAGREILKFARNSQPDGSGTWTLSVIDSSSHVGPFPSLKTINGKPAVSYYDVTNGDLKFAINSANNGSGTWTATTVDATGNVGQFTSLAIVDGRPAISYQDVTNSDLKFAVNSSPDGSGSWSIITVDGPGSVGQSTSLAVAGDKPVISYLNGFSSGVKFARCDTVDGLGSWTTVTITAPATFAGAFTSLAMVEGKPAVAYLDMTNGDLVVATNTEVDGSGSWTNRVVNFNGGQPGSLAVINGKPSISYAFSQIAYARNSDTDGQGVWATLTFDSGTINTGGNSSLVELANNQPGISSSNGSLRWSRFSSSSTPRIEVEQPLGTTRGPGSSQSYGSLVIGDSKTLTFLVKNTGLGPLTLGPIVVAGSHPGDFSVDAQSVPESLQRVQASLFTVTFTPTAGGTRTGILQIPHGTGTFAMSLSGICYTFDNDTDGDGLSDAVEFNLRTLGFSPSINDSARIQLLFENANAAGLFTPGQVQSMNVGTPLLQLNPVTGVFTLSIGLEKTTTLQPGSFIPLPFTVPATTINGEGEIEFQFTSPDDAAFFRLKAE